MAKVSDRCETCGDDYHAEADTEAWMGLYCPGANGTDEAKATYRAELAEKFAQYWEDECRRFFEWEDGREARNAAWDARGERADGRTKADLPDTAQVSAPLQENVNVLTRQEVDRQRRDEVFTPYGGFDLDVSHLTVPGKVPIRPPMVRTKKEKLSDPTDALLYMESSDE